MAHHVPPAGRSLLLRGHPVHDHLAGHHRFQPEQRPAHPGTGHGQGDRPQRGHDRCGAVRFLGLRPVLDALSVGCPLRLGRGQRGCRPEQLRCPALRKPPHELAALYVGRGHHHRPCGDGRGAFRRAELEQRLPVYRPVPDRTDCRAFLQPTPVAQTLRRRPGRHRAQGADPAAGVRAAGREGSDALLFLLLRAGDHRRALGKQLPDPCAAGACPDGCQLCQPVLYRHHGGAGRLRLSDLKAERRPDDSSGVCGAGRGHCRPAAARGAGLCAGRACAGRAARPSTPASSTPPRRTSAYRILRPSSASR